MSKFVRSSGGGGTVDSVARTTISAIIASSGDQVPAKQTRYVAGNPWTNNTAGGITVPASTADADLIGAGLSKGAAVADNNQRFFSIVRTTNSLAAPTAAEIKADNNAVDYTPVALDKAKVVNAKGKAVWFTHNGTGWGTGVTEPSVGGAFIHNIQRTDNALTAPTSTEVASPADGEIAEVVTLNGSYQKWEYVSSAWVKKLEQLSPTAVDVDFKQTWATMQATLVADEKFTAVEPAGTATLVYAVPTALNGAAKGATWDATEAARYTKIGPASTANAATQVLATGDTPAPGQVYVQAVGATHVVPTLTSGQRTTVVNKQADGSTIETTYLHDGTSQTTSKVGGGTAAVAMTGASATVAGSAGLVPAPAVADDTKYLRGDGTWAGLSVTGRYIGSAATFAALPTTSTATGAAISGDWTALSADEVGTGTVASPQYARGIYIYNGTAYSFAVALDAARLALLTQAQAEDEADTNSGLISGQRLNQAMTARDGRDHKHYGSGDTIDFNTAHNLTGDIVRTISFNGTAELTNSPQSGAALGVDGHSIYFGDADNGQQFVYFLKDSLNRETEYWRARGGGTWTDWTAVSSDSWQDTADGWQVSSGMHVRIGDGHKVSFSSSDRLRAIRAIPVSDWSNVGALTAANSWTFDQSFPGSGKQEVVLIPYSSGNRWHVSAVATTAKRTITGSATSIGYDDVDVPCAIALTAGQALDTVSATEGAVVSSINPLLGTFLVKVKGKNTVLTHTTKANVAYNGMMKVGETDHASAALTTAGITLTLAEALQAGDLLEITENYNNNSTENHVHWIRAIAGQTFNSFQYPNASNALTIAFPSPLTKVVTAKGAANQYIKTIRIWRDMAIGFVTPTATTVRQPVDVTVNGGGSQTLYAGTSARILATPPAGQILQSVSAPAGLTVAISDTRTGALEVAIVAGTTGSKDITATFVTPGLSRVIAAANGGVSVPLGTLNARIPASGNRSLQLSSATGAPINLRIQNNWQGGGAGSGIVTMALAASAATFSYVNSSWNFTSAGQWQEIIIEDTTNARWYRLRMEIGSGFNNNTFGGYEII